MFGIDLRCFGDACATSRWTVLMGRTTTYNSCSYRLWDNVRLHDAILQILKAAWSSNPAMGGISYFLLLIICFGATDASSGEKYHFRSTNTQRLKFEDSLVRRISTWKVMKTKISTRISAVTKKHEPKTSRGHLDLTINMFVEPLTPVLSKQNVIQKLICPKHL